MKTIQIVIVIITFIMFSACGSSNAAAKKTTSKTEVTEKGLPPNVASNKHSKKRKRH